MRRESTAAARPSQEPARYRVDVGPVSLCVHEWPGDTDPCLLLHATGFHGRCWDEVARRLPGRRILAVDLRYHGGSGGAGRPDWAEMAADIVRLIERLDLSEITAAGHSIGGHLLVRAAARLPGRFRRLLLIDPVILSPEHYAGLARDLAQLEPGDHPVSRRRNRWRDADEMLARFASRPPFDRWDPEVLRDYCEHALGPAGSDGLHPLACDPVDEAAIYLGQRGNEAVFGELPRVDLPVTLLRAPPNPDDPRDLQSSPTWPGLAAALPDCREVFLPHHSHFIAMEDPALVAKHLLTGQ